MSNKLVEIIRNYNVSDIIKNYLTLTQKGNNYLAICPFHGDTNPSLSINNDRKCWRCFACSNSGDAIKFVMLYKNLNYRNAIIEIAELLGLDTIAINDFKKTYNNENQRYYELNDYYIDYCSMFLKNNENKFALDYLTNRGIDEEIIKKFRIGYNPAKTMHDLSDLLTNDSGKYINIAESNIFTRSELLKNNLAIITNSGDILDTFRNRIVFAICDDFGNVCGFSGRTLDKNNDVKYLNTTETPIFKKSQILYNWNNVSKSNHSTLIMVEGFMDVIALYRCQVPNAVALMGTALTSDHIHKLTHNANLKTIVLGFDNDKAGYTATLNAIPKLSDKFDVYVLKPYDTKCNDLDELLQTYGDKQVKNVVNNQIHASFFLLNDLVNNCAPITSPADKNAFFRRACEIIARYGNKFFINEYCDYLQEYTSYENSIIKSEIINLFVKQQRTTISASINSNSQSKKQNQKNANLIHQNNVSENTYNNLIALCLLNKEACQIIMQKYPLKTSNKTFIIHYQFINKLKLIYEYYSQNCDVKSIKNNPSDFYNYIKINHPSFIDEKFLKEFMNCFKLADKKNNNSQLNYDSLLNIINVAYLNELKIRNTIFQKMLFENNNLSDEQRNTIIATIDENNQKIKSTSLN